MNILIFISILLIGFIIFYEFVYWIMILMLAIINSSAQYDKIRKKSILELAKEDRMWKDVAKILNLESKV